MCRVGSTRRGFRVQDGVQDGVVQEGGGLGSPW